MKVLCSPGLNCYSCPASTTYCPIGAMQQLLAAIRMTLDNGQFFFGFYVVGTIGILGSLVGRMVCGWACPFGLVQELLHKIPSKKFGVYRPLRFIKYVILALMVVILPLFWLNELGLGDPWFCKYVCPAGTLEAGIPLMFLDPGLRDAIGPIYYNKITILSLFVVWSVLASRPFCRTTCPLGAFYALFSRIKLIRLQFTEDRCIRCGACHRVCPMGVKFDQSPNDAECISCLACSRVCPNNAIYLEIGGVPAENLTSRVTKQPQQ